jgi:hypothetical protein
MPSNGNDDGREGDDGGEEDEIHGSKLKREAELRTTKVKDGSILIPFALRKS